MVSGVAHFVVAASTNATTTIADRRDRTTGTAADTNGASAITTTATTSTTTVSATAGALQIAVRRPPRVVACLMSVPARATASGRRRAPRHVFALLVAIARRMEVLLLVRRQRRWANVRRPAQRAGLRG